MTLELYNQMGHPLEDIVFSPFGGNGLQHHPQRRRSYIPSPLGSPAAARRLGQRLGDRLCSSPILSRVKKKWKDGEDQVGPIYMQG